MREAMIGDSIGGSSLTSSRKASHSFRAGRVCKDEECETILSIYNSEDWCAHHRPPTVARMRGVRLPLAS